MRLNSKSVCVKRDEKGLDWNSKLLVYKETLSGEWVNCRVYISGVACLRLKCKNSRGVLVSESQKLRNKRGKTGWRRR